MYTPPFNAVTDEADIRGMVEAVGSAQFITVADDGYPAATLLPIIWEEGDRVVAHMARANPHWRQIAPDSPALLVCTGPEAYVSPSWYATKAEHGKVVPTWNYSAVQLSGTARVVDDPDWLYTAVTDLTDRHEGGRPDRWRVTDAPDAFVRGQLRGIVGLEIRVTRVVAKAKLSQNRSEADRRGVVDGLRAERTGSADAVARQMDPGER